MSTFKTQRFINTLSLIRLKITRLCTKFFINDERYPAVKRLKNFSKNFAQKVKNFYCILEI